MKKRFIFYLIILFLFVGVRVNAQASLNVSTGSTTPGSSLMQQHGIFMLMLLDQYLDVLLM